MLKASTATKTHTAAKAILARLLTITFDTTGGEYCTFAMTMASALSCDGSNCDFEVSEENEGDINSIHVEGDCKDRLRLLLCALMHIIFTKVKQHKFMLVEEGSNVYRLFYCNVKTSKDIKPIFYACFSFVLQSMLTAYVITQTIRNFTEDVYVKEGKVQNSVNLALAAVTAVYSAILAYPSIMEIPAAYDVYDRKIGLLSFMDFVANGFLPTVLLCFGFFVIWGQKSFIEAVLNTAALLFIPEIDDQLPQLIGLQESSVIKNYFISEAMKEYDALHCENESESYLMFEEFVREARTQGMGVQFGDHFITNIPEQTSSISAGFLFQPFQISKGKDLNFGDQIDPSYDVTEKCLIKKISWRYTVFKPAPNTSKPRVGYLKLDMLAGYSIEYKRPDEKDIGLGKEYSLEGVYLITVFQMSNDVLRLRVCGSKTAEDFMTAFDYYSLFDLTPGAKKLLKKHSANDNKKMHAMKQYEEINSRGPQ